MIPRIKSVTVSENYHLHVIFDDGKDCMYDMNEDIHTLEGYSALKEIPGLFDLVQLDESRISFQCVYVFIHIVHAIFPIIKNHMQVIIF